MLDLFSEVTGVSSGDVPRTIAPGVIWDEAAERDFVTTVKHMTKFGLMGRGYKREAAEQSTRWAIEAELYRKFFRREVEETMRCHTPEEKRAHYNRLTESYGEVQRDHILKYFKEARDMVLKW